MDYDGLLIWIVAFVSVLSAVVWAILYVRWFRRGHQVKWQPVVKGNIIEGAPRKISTG